MANNAGEAKVEIYWVYTPANFFEEKIIFKREGYSVEIEGGRIIARMNADFFDSHPSLRDLLTQELKSYFLGAQPYRHRPFELQRGVITRIWPDGKKDHTLEVHGGGQIQASGQADLIYTDDQGIVHDTRRDRIAATKNLAQLSARHASDPTVHRMLDSFDKSVREPGIELVRLYEVGEALAEAFGGQKSAAGNALGISFSQLEALANDRRLKQGRHSGQHPGSQRDATAAQLNEARGIARDMIEKFLRYLEGQRQKKAE